VHTARRRAGLRKVGLNRDGPAIECRDGGDRLLRSARMSKCNVGGVRVMDGDAGPGFGESRDDLAAKCLGCRP